MQLVSIFSNIICLSAATEVPREIFQKWLMSNNRLGSVILTGQLHTLSTYLFLITLIYWPFVQYNNMEMKLLCGLSGLIPATAYILGPYQKLNRGTHLIYLQLARNCFLSQFFLFRWTPSKTQHFVSEAHALEHYSAAHMLMPIDLPPLPLLSVLIQKLFDHSPPMMFFTSTHNFVIACTVFSFTSIPFIATVPHPDR